VITEPLCTASVFASKRLDAFCQRVGEHSLRHGQVTLADLWPARGRRPLVVYVLTRLQKSGGHSRVVEDFIVRSLTRTTSSWRRALPASPTLPSSSGSHPVVATCVSSPRPGPT
jgi:hypothetical protein